MASQFGWLLSIMKKLYVTKNSEMVKIVVGIARFAGGLFRFVNALVNTVNCIKATLATCFAILATSLVGVSS